MSDPLVFIDGSEVLEGKLEEVKTIAKEMVEFVQANEPRPIAYNVYFDADGTRMTVVQIHPDSASMELHMTMAAPAFLKFVGLIELRTMDVYGKPSRPLLEQIRNKVQMLGSATVHVHDHHAGFARL